jgi:hypothetical protein
MSGERRTPEGFMRSVSVRTRCGLALLILLVAVTAVPAFAGDPPPGTEAPQGRIAPPVGVASEAEAPPSVWELFLVWLQGRIHIPVG